MSESVIQNGSEKDTAYKSFPFFRILYRNLTLIICIFIAFGALGTAYGIVTQKPVYTASCQVIVNVKLEKEMYTGNTSLSKFYMKTVSEAIVTEEVASCARTIDPNDRDYAIYSGAVNVSYAADSLILLIKYTAPTAQLAKSKLKKYIKAADKVLWQGNEEESEGNTFGKMGRPGSLQEIQNDYSIDVTSGKTTFIIIGFIAGLVLGVVVAVLRYLLDNKLKDKDELEEIVGVSLLSYIEKQ